MKIETIICDGCGHSIDKADMPLTAWTLTVDVVQLGACQLTIGDDVHLHSGKCCAAWLDKCAQRITGGDRGTMMGASL